MSNLKNIVIVGSGGFAKEVAFLIDEINRNKKTWKLLGYIDETPGEYNGKYSTYKNDNWLETTEEKIHVVFGLGNPDLISTLYNKFKNNKNLHFPSLIHPNAVGDWERIKIGQGNIICASNTFTTDIKIGSFNVFNLDCTVGHDSIIGNFNVINPSVNISGGVTIKNNIMLGTNSTILQYLSIESNSILGGGAVLTKNIKTAGTYIGNPAKIYIKTKSLN